MKKLKAILLSVCSVALCASAVALLDNKTEAVSVSAEVASTWEMVYGASIRTVAPTGIRFTARISEAEYADLTANDADVSFGMIIMPYSYVAEYGDADTFFDADTKYTDKADDTSKVRILHDSVDQLKTKKDGYYYFNVALSDIAESNYEKEFYARAYYTDGTNYYFTPENGTDNVRSVSYVASAALCDPEREYSAGVTARLTQYATQYSEVEYNDEGAAIAEFALNGKFGQITSVTLDGNLIDTTTEVHAYPQNDGTLRLASVPYGRHTVFITNAQGKEFMIPLYRASYVIRTAEDLAGLAADMTARSAHYKLTTSYIVVARNVDYEGQKYAPAAVTFSGTFDGNGHTISNVVVNGNAFLTTATSSPYVKNIVMDNLTFTSGALRGGFVGTVGANGKFENVIVRGTNGATTAGGLLACALTIKSAATSSGYTKNCIVIDRANYGAARKAALGDLSAVPTATTGKGSYDLSNVLVVSTGWAITAAKKSEDYTSSFDITQVGAEADITAAELRAFAEAAGAESGWIYDETTGELSLMGNVVFTVSPNSDL